MDALFFFLKNLLSFLDCRWRQKTVLKGISGSVINNKNGHILIDITNSESLIICRIICSTVKAYSSIQLTPKSLSTLLSAGKKLPSPSALS
jgi:hypothetical protein